MLRTGGRPKSAGADAGTTQSIYYSAGANAADAACGNVPEYAGYLCKNTPQGTGSVSKHQTGFNIYGQPATFTEASTGTDSAKRTTTQTYRADGQELKTTVTTSGITTVAVPPVEKLYDATGVQNGVRALASGTLPQSEVKWTQDLWGRTTSYTNSLGETTTTEYDGFGNVSKTVSPVSTSTYKYGALSSDGTAEYQGVVTSMTVSNHGGSGTTGTYTASYDGDGNILTQTIPGGFTQRMDYDESGKQVRLAYDGPLKAEDGTASNGTWIAWELNRDTTGLTAREIADLCHRGAATVHYHLQRREQYEPGFRGKHEAALAARGKNRPSTLWRRRAKEVAAFQSENGRLPRTTGSRTERAMHDWLAEQRRLLNAGELPPSKVLLLQDVAGWRADPRQLELDELWRTRLAALRQYVVENKCLPRYRKYGSDTERFLGVWLHNQHQRRSRGILSTWRLEALDSDLPGWRSRA